ncbi:MAG: hypothetical protein ACRDWY_13740, partial [Actinomycetes bacterium]
MRRLDPALPARPTGWVPDPPPQPALRTPRASGSRAARSRADVADRLPVGLRAAVVAPGARAVAGLALLVALAVVTALIATWLA